MNSNLKVLIKACMVHKIPYKIHQLSGTIVEVLSGGKSHLFINSNTPLNSQSLAYLCQDKEYFYTLFRDSIKMPYSKGFINPSLSHLNIGYPVLNLTEIITAIEQEFTYPLIVKNNRGSAGIQVYQVNDRSSLGESLTEIFHPKNVLGHHLALAQKYINIKQEYRVIYLNRKLKLVYQKSTANAQFTGNISPLHWDNSQAILIKDSDLLTTIDRFCQPLFDQLLIPFCGLDIVRDQSDDWWLIEANTSPGFKAIIRDAGEEAIVQLYTDILNCLN